MEDLMVRFKIVAFAMFLSILSGFVLAAPVAAGQEGEPAVVQWHSYVNGMEKLQQGEKTGFLYFYTDWCGYCKKADQETFSDKQVSSYLNENFVPIRVNADEEKALARQYGVVHYPSNIFLSPEGEVIAARPGYIPADQMIDILAFIHTDSFKTMTFREFTNR